MNVRELSSLVWRNICFAKRKNCSLIAIIALATALITGALILGSSVRQSLRDEAFARSGEVDAALLPQNRWFSDELTSGMQGEAISIIQVDAFSYDKDGLPRKVKLYGVDERFFPFVYGQKASQVQGEALISAESLSQLGLNAGEALRLRLPASSHFAEGLSWSLGEQEMMGLRLPTRVAEVETGFQLSSGQRDSINVFISKSELAQKLDKEGRGNILLCKGAGAGQLRDGKLPSLGDYGLKLSQLPSGQWELQSEQTFIPEAVAQAVAAVGKQERLFTYFVNEIKAGGHSTPYSFITGASDSQLQGSECSITQWLADDLQVKAGHALDITYFELQAQGELKQAEGQLIVKNIIPTADRRELTPPFPGFTDSESCDDWDPSIPVDMDSIRDKDEAYWDEYQGSPKLFISLAKAQVLFGSSHGQLSAIRFEDDPTVALEQALAQHIRLFQELPLKQLNAAGSEQAMDFAGLFLALSFFVIVAALILLLCIAKLRLQAKQHELALLQSLGYSHGILLRLLMAEFAAYTIVGALMGCALAFGYVSGILYLLNTLWNSVSGYSIIAFHWQMSDLVIGFAASMSICLASIFVLSKRRQQLKRDFSQKQWTRSDQVQTAVLALLTVGLMATAGDASLFFGCSFLLLLLCFKLAKYALLKLRESELSFWGLALRNISRNIARSMSILSTFSLGLFICLLTIINYRDMGDDASPQAGTGGYYGIIETVVPIRHHLNSAEGKKEYKLPEEASIQYHQLKRADGSLAGCLNLNRVVRPQVLAAPLSALEGRFTFTDSTAQWQLLEESQPDNIIPIIADAEVVQWSLGKQVGDCIPYTAEGGQEYQLKIVATLDKSIFQGYVLCSEANMARMYPSMGGSNIILLDYAAKPYIPSICKALERQGSFFTTAAQRLAQFNEVQNTYLVIFFVLGTIGLIMATGGHMLLLQHQLKERQSELKLLHAIGHSPSQISSLILRENLILLGLALLSTLIALAAALIPLAQQNLINPPYGMIVISLALITLAAVTLLHLQARRR